MNQDEFEKFYFVKFETTGDWPEVEKEKYWGGIYSHKCPICGIGFAGYKRRRTCYPCHLTNTDKE